jgi:hypothetical protein
LIKVSDGGPLTHGGGLRLIFFMVRPNGFTTIQIEPALVPIHQRDADLISSRTSGILAKWNLLGGICKNSLCVGISYDQDA